MLKKFASVFTAAAMAATLLTSVTATADDADEVSKAQAFVSNMGIGINLGNTFESCGSWINSSSVTNYETGWGSLVITEEMIQGYADAGFKTLRIPVAWSNMMADDYTIDSSYMARVKEVTQWAVDAGLYVIVNEHWDGGWINDVNSTLYPGFSFSQNYDKTMEKYLAIWTQVAEEFKDFDEHVIFESLNEEGTWSDLYNLYNYDATSTAAQTAYGLLNTINQEFVNLVRESGGNNATRMLYIAGYGTDVDATCLSLFEMPDDPAEMCAVSVHYYTPSLFAIATNSSYWGSGPQTTWGTDSDYETLDYYVNMLKTTFVDNGIPVIIGECGCASMENKDREEVIEYTNAVIEAFYTAGMCPVLWDTYYAAGASLCYYNRSTCSLNDSEIALTIANLNAKSVSTTSFEQSTYTYTYGDVDTFTVSATTTGDGAISYSSSDEKVVTVDDNGVVTIVGAGTATITATAAEGSSYLSSSATAEVTINKIENPTVSITEVLNLTDNYAKVAAFVLGDDKSTATMSVVSTIASTDDIELPEGWQWLKSYDLSVGETTSCLAYYTDTNYENRTVKVSVYVMTESETEEYLASLETTTSSQPSASNSSVTSSETTETSDSDGSSDSASSSSQASSSTASTTTSASGSDSNPSTGATGLAGTAILLLAAAAVVVKKKQ